MVYIVMTDNCDWQFLSKMSHKACTRLPQIKYEHVIMCDWQDVTLPKKQKESRCVYLHIPHSPTKKHWIYQSRRNSTLFVLMSIATKNTAEVSVMSKLWILFTHLAFGCNRAELNTEYQSEDENFVRGPLMVMYWLQFIRSHFTVSWGVFNVKDFLHICSQTSSEWNSQKVQTHQLVSLWRASRGSTRSLIVSAISSCVKNEKES